MDFYLVTAICEAREFTVGVFLSPWAVGAFKKVPEFLELACVRVHYLINMVW